MQRGPEARAAHSGHQECGPPAPGLNLLRLRAVCREGEAVRASRARCQTACSPATIAAALVVAPVALSPMNVAGIFLACAGAGLFALL